MKKIIAVLLALVTALSLGTVAFAEDVEPAEEAYVPGSSLTAVYQISSGKVFPYDKAEITLADGKTVPLKDTTTYGELRYQQQEAVNIVAYYAMACPACGKAIGGESYSYIRSQYTSKITYAGESYSFTQKCPHCIKKLAKEKYALETAKGKGDYDAFLTAEDKTAIAALGDNEAAVQEYINNAYSTVISSYYTKINELPTFCLPGEAILEDGEEAPADLKVYRFVIVSSNSAHFKQYRNKDFTNDVKEIFGDTAKYYGDGKDLPQTYLTFDETQSKLDVNTCLESFTTSGSAVVVDSTDNFFAKILSSISNFIEMLKVNSITVLLGDIADKIGQAILKLLQNIAG